MKSDPMHRVVVAAMIESPSGELLVAQRPEGKWGAGKWEFPGGKLEPGEDPIEALKRECREELGVELGSTVIYDTACHRYSDEMPSIVLLFFRTVIRTGKPMPLDGGKIEWATGEKLLEYDWLEADLPVVHQWLNELNALNALEKSPDEAAEEE